MGRAVKRLSARGVETADKPGYLCDGDGLYLQISQALTKSWVFRYRRNGKLREMGLGPARDIKLAEAREKAAECRKILREGGDPIDAKRAARQAQAKIFTFDQCAEAYINAHRASWSNPKHADQWINTIKTYASPVFGDLPVDRVTTDLIVKVLAPIWETKTETATRLRQRIEKILGWATTSKMRTGENPAQWRGHLENLLAKPTKIKKVEHHEALPFREIGSFVDDLRKRQDKSIGALALEFTILTALRTGEVIGAKWDEFDLQEKVWTAPAERMKMKKEHRVPLSPRALEIIENLKQIRTNEFVFPGGVKGKPLSTGAMDSLLERMGRADITVHGFRSAFRDWAAETTAYPNEVVEMALAHAIKNKVEAAYRRGDLFIKRQRLMDDWAKYCSLSVASGDNVTGIRGLKEPQDLSKLSA